MAKTVISKFKVIERPKDVRMQQIGYGAELKVGPKTGAGRPQDRAGFGALSDWIKSSVACPIWNMPVIEQSRVTLNGSTDTTTLDRLFGTKIDIFNIAEGTSGIDYVETTMAQPGELQVNTIVCAVGFQIEIAPQCWTALGVGITSFGTPQNNIPPAADSFTLNDVYNGAFGPNFSGASPAQAYYKAVLEYGWWAGQAAWHMVRGYDFRWMVGRHTRIMDDVLRHTAFLPTNAQNGSAGTSQVDIAYAVQQANLRYQSQFDSSLMFLPANRTRMGSATVSSANIGVMLPTRAYELVNATQGGIGLREELKGNSEFRKLTVPYMLKGGIPIGLSCHQCDNDQGDQMRAYMDNSYGQKNGAVPALITPSTTQIAENSYDGVGSGGSDTTPVGLELTLDTSPVQVFQRFPLTTALFKYGPLKFTQAIKGFEVPDDTYTQLQNDSDLRDAVMGECDCRFAKSA